MKRDDVRRLQSFLYTGTKQWPKWHELGKIVNYIYQWPELANSGVAAEYGVCRFQAYKSNGSWHFRENGHPSSPVTVDFWALYVDGTAKASNGATVKTDGIYNGVVKWVEFKFVVQDLFNKHAATLGPTDTLMIKDIGKY